MVSRVKISVASARNVADQWRSQYSRKDGGWDVTVSGSSLDIYEKLCALGHNPDIHAVAEVIGNKSWSHLSCSACGEQVERLVSYAPVYSDNEVALCEPCLKGHVWLRFEDGILKATTTTLDEAVTATLPTALGAGSITADAERLGAFVKFLSPTASVALKEGPGQIVGGTLECRSGSSVHRIPAQYEKDYPVVVASAISSPLSWTVDAEWLRKMFVAASGVIEFGTIVRPALHGVHFEYGTTPHLSGAESYGLFRCEADAFRGEIEGGFLFPSEAVKFSCDILKSGLATIILSEEKNAASIACENVVLRTKLIDAKTPIYPNYLPQTIGATFEADSETLLNTLTLGLVPGIRDNRLEIKIGGDTLSASSNSPDMGTASDECQVFEYEGDPVVFNINAQYLKWAISSLDCETISAKVTPSESKIVFSKKGDPSSVRMAMMYGGK